MNDIWQRIGSTIPKENQFCRLSWYEAWTCYLKEENNWQGDLEYCVAKGNDASEEAIIPYAYQKVGPFLFASLAGNYFPHRAFPYNGKSQSLLDNIVSEISTIKGISGFRLAPVEAKDTFLEKLKETFSQNNWKILTRDAGQDFGIFLPDSEDEFLASLSSKRKYKIRRRWRGMEELGTAEIKRYNSISSEEWETVFQEVETVEEKAWISEMGEPRFAGKANQQFWNNLVQDEWFSKAINIWIMYLDQEPVSYSISIDSGEIRYGLATSYCESIAQFSPGQKFQMEVATQAIRAGIKTLNEGMGDSGYKQKSGSIELSKLIEIIAFPPTLKGKVAYLIALLKEKIG